MAQVSGYFQIIAVKDGEDVESWSIEASVPLHLDGYNVQLNPLTFYVDHKKGSSSQRVRAYFTIRYFTASFEAGNDVIQAETDNLIYTYPADKYGYATNLKVEAYSDSERKNKITERVFDIIRDNPVYKARIELWKDILIFKHGELILLNNKVYMWDYPIAGNSKISPELDRKQNEQDKPYKQDGKTHWIPYENYDLIATNILFSQYALLGGAVMTGRMNADTGLYDYAKMFSQTGKEGLNETTNYEKFDPSKDAWDSTQSWTPNACIDWKTGKTWFKDTTIDGDVKANTLTAIEGGQIGPFKISSKDELRAESLYQGGNTGSNGLKQYLHLKSDSIYFGVTGGDISAEIGINSGSIWSGYQGCAAFYNNLKHTFEGDINSNNGIYIEVSGANKDDNIPGAGNHALFLAKGDVVGFRPYTRRINTDGERLSIYDTLVFVIKSGINIYLPSGSRSDVEDGQFYMIVNTTGSKIRITGTFAGTTKYVDLSSWHMGFFTYDAVNRYWCGVFSAHF